MGMDVWILKIKVTAPPVRAWPTSSYRAVSKELKIPKKILR
jgi:hypothetical protein